MRSMFHYIAVPHICGHSIYINYIHTSCQFRGISVTSLLMPGIIIIWVGAASAVEHVQHCDNCNGEFSKFSSHKPI